VSADALRGFDDLESAPRAGSGIDRLRQAWSRRKWLAILVALVPLTAGVSIIMALPDLYQSTALVMIERQQVPEAFVRPTVTSQLEIRLQTISQEILSRSRLETLITRFNLYPELRTPTSTEQAVDRMRTDIRLELKAGENNRAGTTTAFALSYRGRDPQTVALVTNTLASFYIEENLKARERQATGTAEFLRVQLADAKKRLDEQETRVSALRRRYLGQLPQQMQSNLATLDSLSQQLRVNSDNQVRLVERRDQLATQLAQARAVSGDETDEVRLARLRRELAMLRIKYTDLWPDIIRVKDEIATLEKQMAEPKAASSAKAPLPPTPEVIRVREMLQVVETELKLAKVDEQRIRRAIELYQTRIENTPKSEQEFLEMTRDYEATRELYQTLSKRYDEALLAESMEQRQKGEQFRVLDSALPSSVPTAPRRGRLLLICVAVALALGVGAAVLAEMLDTSFHSSDDLRAYTTVPLLVSIPRIVTMADSRRERWRFRFATLGVIVCLVVIAGSCYFFAHGNEQLAQLLSRGGRA
jgi:polysaccharide chain length determinant protein (PEP-CTERM system associated)